MTSSANPRPHLISPWLVVARLVWIGLVLLILVLVVISAPTRYHQLLTLSSENNRALLQLNPEEGRALRQLGLSLDFYAVFFTTLESMFTVVFAAIGLVIFWRRSSDGWVMFVAFTLVSIGATLTPFMDALAALRPAWSLPITYVQLLGTGCFLVFLYLFPDGRFAPRWTRGLAVVWALWLLVTPLLFDLSPSSPVINPFDVAGLGWFATGVVAQIYRYFRVSNSLQRQQSKWVVFGLVATLLAYVAGGLLYLLLPGRGQPSGPNVLFSLFLAPVFVFSLLVVPLSISFAILRYRLWDIDQLLNRTLVYGALTTFVIGMYVLAVGGLGELLQTRSTFAPILLTTVAMVALFRPLRARLQRSVDHLMYGRAGQPHAPMLDVKGELPSNPAVESVRLWHNPTSLAVAFVALSLMALGTAFVWLRLSTPSDGVRLQPGEFVWTREGVVVTPIGESPGGLRRSDVVIAVDGQSLEAWAQDLFRWEAARLKRELGQTVVYTIFRDGSRQEVPVTLGHYPLTQWLAQYWGICLLLLVNQAVATYVFFRRSQDLAARLLFFTATSLLVGGSVWSMGLQLSDLTGAFGFWLYTLVVRGAYILGWVTLFHFTLVFPRPQPGITRRPAIIWGIYAAPYLAYFGFLIVARLREPSTLLWLEEWRVAHGAINILYIGLAVLMTILSYRRTGADPIARRQIYWLFFAFVLFGVLEIGVGLAPEILLGHPLLDWNLIALSGMFIPIALAIAILRYHLFDIDVIINRALVYGALTAIVVGLYVAMVATASLLFQAGNSLLVSLIATGVVAVLFQPLRDRFQRAVNRLMYGDRDDPYAVLSRLGQRLETTLAPETVLPALAETIAQTLKLPYVAITLQHASRSEPDVAAAYGLPIHSVVRLPLIYQSEHVGELLIAPRAPAEAFTQAEQRLLSDIAHQAGVAVHAVRLTTDLQHSRERLVAAREEERRRLRRDLHDGLGPKLAGQTLKLEAARDSLDSDPQSSRALLNELIGESQTVVTEIRRLVYALRPPALDELGLIAAVRELAAQCELNGLRVTVDTPEASPPLPAAVEVAAYRILQEALTNVVRHARAHHCHVGLRLADAAVHVEVSDDGLGFPAVRHVGVGLTSMRERAEEIGGECMVEAGANGGTRVVARLPCRKPEAYGSNQPSDRRRRTQFP